MFVCNLKFCHSLLCGCPANADVIVQAIRDLRQVVEATAEEQRKRDGEQRVRDEQARTKPASECTETDYNNFHIADASLDVKMIAEATFQEVYVPIFEDADFCLRLTRVRQGKETEDVQPLTKDLIRSIIAARLTTSESLSLGMEVGFHSKAFRRHGFADKATCPLNTQSPDVHRPSKANSKGFDSPVILLGSWEDKGLGRCLKHTETAELACAMAGFVEGAQRTHKVHFRRFGGILVGVQQNSGGQKELVCRCLLWCLTKEGEEYRATSRLSETQREFASGVEWWMNECLCQLKDYEQQRSRIDALTIQPVTLLSSIPEGGGQEKPQEQGKSHVNVSEATSSATNVLQGSPTRTSDFLSSRMRLSDYIVDAKSKDWDENNQQRTRCWLHDSKMNVNVRVSVWNNSSV